MIFFLIPGDRFEAFEFLFESEVDAEDGRLLGCLVFVIHLDWMKWGGGGKGLDKINNEGLMFYEIA